MARLPKLGGVLLDFLQPLRVLALLPPIFAVALVVALEEGAAALRHAGFSIRWRRFELAALLPVATVFGVLAFALPLRVRATNDLVAPSAGKAAALCNAIEGFEPRVLGGWLEQLQGGSLWFDERETTPLIGCLSLRGLELKSAVPIATTSSVGAHVGMLWAAGKQLQPERAGFARRAEAFGVRYVLQMKRPNAAIPAGFVRRKSRGQVELLELAAGARAHVGCVRERWSGSDRALRERLTHDLADPAGADKLLDPERLIELQTTSGEVKTESVLSDCDSTRAELELVPREPGAIEVDVSSHAPVDVAFHATAFPSWRVSVDGAAGIPARMIAPGFFYAHVGAGQHHLLATAGSMPGYAGLLAAAMLAIAGLAWLDVGRVVARVRRSR